MRILAAVMEVRRETNKSMEVFYKKGKQTMGMSEKGHKALCLITLCFDSLQQEKLHQIGSVFNRLLRVEDSFLKCIIFERRRKGAWEAPSYESTCCDALASILLPLFPMIAQW
mmetsp:Transcript_22092/g.36407  ORF Transcript_22092/g.36407 Transcript_22092/m.36407 type:complete len:113 (-) Transcript_22092:15-353(-)